MTSDVRKIILTVQTSRLTGENLFTILGFDEILNKATAGGF